MRLVVNTNRIIAALIKNSASRKIIMSRKFELVTVGFGIYEIRKHKQEILNKARIIDADFEVLLSTFLKKIYVVSDIVIRDKVDQARRIMDSIDPDDSPFIALALSIETDGIWSDDEHYTKQKTIKVWKTTDLLKYVK